MDCQSSNSDEDPERESQLRSVNGILESQREKMSGQLRKSYGNFTIFSVFVAILGILPSFVSVESILEAIEIPLMREFSVIGILLLLIAMYYSVRVQAENSRIPDYNLGHIRRKVAGHEEESEIERITEIYRKLASARKNKSQIERNNLNLTKSLSLFLSFLVILSIITLNTILIQMNPDFAVIRYDDIGLQTSILKMHMAIYISLLLTIYFTNSFLENDINRVKYYAFFRVTGTYLFVASVILLILSSYLLSQSGSIVIFNVDISYKHFYSYSLILGFCTSIIYSIWNMRRNKVDKEDSVGYGISEFRIRDDYVVSKKVSKFSLKPLKFSLEIPSKEGKSTNRFSLKLLKSLPEILSKESKNTYYVNLNKTENIDDKIGKEVKIDHGIYWREKPILFDTGLKPDDLEEDENEIAMTDNLCIIEVYKSEHKDYAICLRDGDMNYVSVGEYDKNQEYSEKRLVYIPDRSTADLTGIIEYLEIATEVKDSDIIKG